MYFLQLIPLLVGFSTVVAVSFDDDLDFDLDDEDVNVDANSCLQKQVTRHIAHSVGNVLYMVKSYHGAYETKLKAVVETWGSLIDPSSLLLLGDRKWEHSPPIQQATMCPSDPSYGLACRVAYGMTVAAKHPSEWSWLYVVDDDHYVRPFLVEQQLALFNPTPPIAAGCYGCGRPQYCGGNGGFCGGCGYAFSRSAVQAMVGNDTDAFMAAHAKIAKSKETDAREDMAITCLLQRRVPGVKLEQMPGLGGKHTPSSHQRPSQSGAAYTMAEYGVVPQDQATALDEPIVPTARRAFPLRAGALSLGLLGATAVLAVFGHASYSSARLRISPKFQMTELAEEDDPCNKMPYLIIHGIKVNNLGGKGPETEKEEGIIYSGEAHNEGINHSNIELHIHAATENFFDPNHPNESEVNSGYTPQWPKENGITGRFGTINVKPGSNVTLTLHGYDPAKEKNIELPAFAMTFFDLDTGKDGRSQEFLRINNFASYYLTNSTELDVMDEGDGSMVFKGTVEGNGDDNPTKPLELTPLQKNRAVSFVFNEVKEVVFEVGSSAGLTGRVFQFVIRPVMRCAYTVLPDGTLLDANDPLNPVRIARGGHNSAHSKGLASVFLLLALFHFL